MAGLSLWICRPQVPFFLFIVFVVYTLLPLSMRGAIAVGVLSTISHLLVFGVLMGTLSTPCIPVELQVSSGLRVEVGDRFRPLLEGRGSEVSEGPMWVCWTQRPQDSAHRWGASRPDFL